KLGIDFGKDVAGKITHIAFGVGNPFRAMVKKGVKEGPDSKEMRMGPDISVVLIIEAADENTARKFVEKIVPKVVRRIAGPKAPEPTVKETNGHKIHSIMLSKRGGVHYGRHGKVVVLGPFPDGVAQSLASGADKKGWLGDDKLAARVKEAKDPLAV